MSEARLYSVVLAWDDDDDEQGDFGTVVRASSAEEAEAKARQEMRNCHLENYPPEDGESEEEACALYTDKEGVFGGKVISIDEGAIWRAAELERALRDLVPYGESRAEDLNEELEELGPAASFEDRMRIAKANRIIKRAKDLLGELDAIDAEAL